MKQFNPQVNPLKTALICGPLLLGFCLLVMHNADPRNGRSSYSIPSATSVAPSPTWSAPPSSSSAIDALLPTSAPVPTVLAPGASSASSGAPRVWVNSKTGVYHFPGGRWFGTTKEGFYTTEAQAKADGYRESQR
jgi:hypothetical protein